MSAGISVAVIRGEALNPYELQVYAHLPPTIDVLGVGRTRPLHEITQIRVPVKLLPSLSQRRLVQAAQRRLAGRLPVRLAADRLVGLRSAVAGRQILHAAETALPVTEQAAELCGGGGPKLLLTCWETIPFRYDDNPLLAARKRRVKSAAAHYLAVTERARMALVLEGVSEDRITVVPAGVDVDRFRPREPSQALRRSWGVPTGAPVVLYVGRLIQEKGLVELVRAFAAGTWNAHLVLIGSGDQSARVSTAAAALGVSDRVHLQSSSSYTDLPLGYATADVVVAPSLTTPYWEEQFGMVLAEAMACGRALISTTSGAIPEVVGDAAVLVEPYDIAQLAGALDALLGDEVLRQRLGVAARERALSKYAPSVVARGLEAVYRRVLSS
jgi:glycosyltransferase involved in cell wall biosynthesis